MPRTALHGTARWQELRAAQLASEPFCRKCRNRGVLTPATVADHVVPHRGDPDLFWNGELQSLCDHCHNSTKQREERSDARIDIDEDGIVAESLFSGRRVSKGGRL